VPVYFDAVRHRPLGVTPGHCVVPRQRTGRVIERAEDGVTNLLRHVQGRAQAADLVGVDHSESTPRCLFTRAPARGAHRGVGVRERKMPALRIHDIDVDLFGEPAEQFDRFLVKDDAFRREIVGTDDRRVRAVLPPPNHALSSTAIFLMP